MNESAPKTLTPEERALYASAIDAVHMGVDLTPEETALLRQAFQEYPRGFVVSIDDPEGNIAGGELEPPLV